MHEHNYHINYHIIQRKWGEKEENTKERVRRGRDKEDKDDIKETKNECIFGTISITQLPNVKQKLSLEKI